MSVPQRVDETKTEVTTQNDTPFDPERGIDEYQEKADGSSTELQAGVQGIEAALTVWTKWHLVAAYGL